MKQIDNRDPGDPCQIRQNPSEILKKDWISVSKGKKANSNTSILQLFLSNEKRSQEKFQKWQDRDKDPGRVWE